MSVEKRDSIHGIKTPIFIISFNRAWQLKRSIASYQQLENIQIIIHDNGSDDKHTIEYLKELEKNGVIVNWFGKISTQKELNNVNKSIERYFSNHKKVDYIVTDPDIELLPGAKHTLKIYKHFLESFKDAESVGPMLKIDDIPRTHPLYNEIINRHVFQFWQHKPKMVNYQNEQIAYQRAKIDTTFSLHRAGSTFKRLTDGIRLYGIYAARHLDWYDEDFINHKYYQQSHQDIAHWGSKTFHEKFREEPIKYKYFYDIEDTKRGFKVIKKFIQPIVTKKPSNVPIKLYWFRRQNSNERNFGDELSAGVVEKLSGRQVQCVEKEMCNMVAVGSVLESVLARKNQQKVTVWGTGLMFDKALVDYNKEINDIRLVRGRLSAQKLGLSQNVCGDPGLLADMLYKPSGNKKKITIVPHYVDQNNSAVLKLAENKQIKVINVFDSPKKVITEIASSELVISSSLHGLIVAHSFGIPAYWTELSNDVAGEGFKFRDHYSIFNQSPAKLSTKQFSNIISEADSLIEHYKFPKNLKEIKTSLIRTFPHNV